MRLHEEIQRTAWRRSVQSRHCQDWREETQERGYGRRTEQETKIRPGDTSALARRFRWASHGTVLRQETDHERKKRLAEAKRRDKVSLTCLELTELRSSTACPGREQAARPAFRRLDGQRGRHLSIASWRRLGGATASTGRSRRLRGHVRTQEVNGASIPGHW
jgi:hypothetical protein